MAAGVAHEINNPLAGILLYSTNLLKKSSKNEPFKEALEIIIQEALRCKTIIQDLLEFSRESEPKMVLANVNNVIEKVLNILDNEFKLQPYTSRQASFPASAEHLPGREPDSSGFHQSVA